MTRRYHRMKDMALAVMLGAMMAACSDEPVQDVQPNHELCLALGAQQFAPVTRTLPEGFETYEQTQLPTDVQILGFLASTNSAAEPVQGLFSPSTTTGLPRWTSRIKIDEDGEYYFYGFMPKRVGNNASISLNTSLTPPSGETLSYKHGASLIIDGLSAISTDDVCVIVGVKGYTPANTTDPLPSISDAQVDMTDRLGKFDINIAGDVTNAYLLVDHVYSRLLFKLKIDDRYSRLRTIKVKRMTLVSGDGTDLVKTVSALVNIGFTDADNLNPVANGGEGRKITLTTQAYGQPDTPAMLYDNETDPLVLTTTAKEVQASFASSSVRRLILETTYDVYDSKGNLIRENQTAQNTFTPPALVSGQQSVYTITVDPTYLYVLSDPDPDSPTFTMQ